MPRRWSSLFPLIAVLLFQTWSHLYWLSIPTTGGQVTVPWMIANGNTLFGDIIENRAPLTELLMAVVHAVSPFNPIDNVRLMNLVLVLSITLTVYIITIRLSNGNKIAAISAILFWMIWEPVYGNLTFYFDTVLGLFIGLAVLAWLLLSTRRPGWLAPFLVGLLLGAGVISKQHGWGAVGMFGLWLLMYYKQGSLIHDIPAFVMGALALPIASVAYFAAQGNLDEYFYFTYTYNLSGFIIPSPIEGNFIRKLMLTHMLAPAFLLVALQKFIRKDEHSSQWILLGMMYLASLMPLIPHLGEIHGATSLLPLAVMTGLIVAELFQHFAQSSWRSFLKNIALPEITLVGIGLMILLAWGITAIAPYFHVPLGRAKTPGYDEFHELIEVLAPLQDDGTTLEVLPKLAGNSQLFEMSGMVSPGVWTYSDASFYFVPGLSERILSDWSEIPPDIVVYFPELQEQYVGQAIDTLVAFVLNNDTYELVSTVDDVMFNGDALIYRRRD